jgi:hypothetical protein
MKKAVKLIRAILSALFKKEDKHNWARDQILKMGELKAKLIL